MRRAVLSFGLYPLVTASALCLVQPAQAQPARPAPVAWWTDYNAARKEAHEKGLPLVLVIGTDNCFYCRKLEAGPLKDAGVARTLAAGFVAVKLDATRVPELAKALKVQLYPTTVIAAPDGKIHAFIEGYVEADRLAEQLKRSATTVATPDWAARDFGEASKALAVGDYPRAVTLLKRITRDAGEKPVGAKAKQLLDEVEKVAAGALARARELEQRGQIPEAMDALAGAVKQYAGARTTPRRSWPGWPRSRRNCRSAGCGWPATCSPSPARTSAPAACTTASRNASRSPPPTPNCPRPATPTRSLPTSRAIRTGWRRRASR
jgi:hypothetical protein